MQIACAAQQPCRFLQQTAVVKIAWSEQQLVLDRRRAGPDVQRVGEPEERGVLLGQRGVEDLEGGDPDLTDAHPRCGQAGVVGQIGGSAPGLADDPGIDARQHRARGP
jgi:hypothetical protein